MAPSPEARVLELRSLEECCDESEASWRDGQRPRLSEFVDRLEPAVRFQGFSELLAIEVAYRRERGEYPTPQDYLGEFTEFESQIREEFANIDATQLVDDT